MPFDLFDTIYHQEYGIEWNLVNRVLFKLHDANITSGGNDAFSFLPYYRPCNVYGTGSIGARCLIEDLSLCDARAIQQTLDRMGFKVSYHVTFFTSDSYNTNDEQRATLRVCSYGK